MPHRVEVTLMKCACADCYCVVSRADAIMKDGKPYCCDACAEHHASGTKCEHAGCTCHG